MANACLSATSTVDIYIYFDRITNYDRKNSIFIIKTFSMLLHYLKYLSNLTKKISFIR